MERQRPDVRRVAFVADELLGYAGNGIGTTTTFIAVALARAGHHVEVLFAGPPRDAPVDPEWQRLYDAANVRVRQVKRRAGDVSPSQFSLSRDVEAALREDPPDVVVVQDLGAPAYTALRLRRLGLDFAQTTFVVFCHGTRQWIADVSGKVRVLPGAQMVSVLERASVELADAVVSPSRYLVDWMAGAGWGLPEQTFVIPHVTRAGATGQQPPSPPPAAPVERIAFFGRLEERKGVRPFVEGLNLVDPELLRRVEVEFLGRPTPAWPTERVESLLSHDVKASFHTALDQHEALARLRTPGTLVVLPSFEENSPNTVYECLENALPFIASNAAGIRELVAPGDHARVLFEPTGTGVAEALQRTIGTVVAPARATYDAAGSLRQWEDVFALRSQPARAGGTKPPVDIIAGERRAAVAQSKAEWLVFLAADDVADEQLVPTLVRAQQASGADVVSCGLTLGDGRTHLFPGEPRALGLLANGYGTVALIRRELLDAADEDLELDWPLLAKLSVTGAHVVSAPTPLVRTSAAPATLETDPDQALRVMRHFERALPRGLELTAELVPRLAAAAARTVQPPRRSLARRAVGKLLGARGR